jgi:hypothetical protein
MKYYYKEGKLYNSRGKSVGHQDGKYIKHKINGRRQFIHRVIYELHHGPVPAGYDVDHINYNTLDNRIENLQLLTKEEHRQRRENTGTIKERGGKFQAARNHKYLGTFATRARAIMACALYKIA